MAGRETKVVRSYRLVFRRRWRIFRIGNWRMPLPGGLELRLIGYWLGCLAAVSRARPPAAPRPADRGDARRRCACWRSRCSPPGRSAAGSSTAAHRIGPCSASPRWWLRPRVLAAGRRVPAPGTEISPLEALVLDPDLEAPQLPRGRVEGPARLLLRYPISGTAAAASLRLRRRPGPALHKGHVLEVPPGHAVVFEDERA